MKKKIHWVLLTRNNKSDKRRVYVYNHHVKTQKLIKIKISLKLLVADTQWIDLQQPQWMKIKIDQLQYIK